MDRDPIERTMNAVLKHVKYLVDKNLRSTQENKTVDLVMCTNETFIISHPVANTAELVILHPKSSLFLAAAVTKSRFNNRTE